MNEYHLFCLICGQPFKSGRRHSKTCSVRCRALLAESMKILPGEQSPNLTDEEANILRTLQNKERQAKQSPPTPPVREEDKIEPIADPTLPDPSKKV